LDGGRTGVRLTLDGQEGFPIGTGTEALVRQSSSSATLLRPPESDHFDKLAEKLNWGV
jgi:NAD kinase